MKIEDDAAMDLDNLIIRYGNARYDAGRHRPLAQSAEYDSIAAEIYAEIAFRLAIKDETKTPYMMASIATQAMPNTDTGSEWAARHHLFIYEVDFGAEGKGRYIRLSDFNRVCEKLEKAANDSKDLRTRVLSALATALTETLDKQ